MTMIKAGNGVAELKTVAGGKLWVMMKGNGVIQVVDHVLMPA